MNIPRITRDMARQFSGEFLFNGKVAVVMDDVSFQFAAEFAQAVLNTVFQQYMAEQEARKKALVVATS